MIEVKECSKAFGTVKAVNKATLDVGVREVFGLVGSNGAGKSTLLRMMAGIIKPDEGEIQIDGMPVYDNEEASDDEIDQLEEASVLKDISHMPARVKCAVLGWRTLNEMFKDGK